MQWWSSIFVAGAIGGMSPELARMTVRAQSGEFASWLAKLGKEEAYSGAVPVIASIGILLLLAIIGGLVAHFVREEDKGKAFLLGIGAPAFLLSTLSAASPSRDVTKPTPVLPAAGETNNGFFLFSNAFAQSEPNAAPAKVLLDIGAISKQCVECRVVLQDANGQELGIQAVIAGAKQVEFVVPAGAATATIEGVGNTNNAQFSLDGLGQTARGENGVVDIQVLRSRNYLNDFRYLLGNGAIQPFDIELKAAPVAIQ